MIYFDTSYLAKCYLNENRHLRAAAAPFGLEVVSVIR